MTPATAATDNHDTDALAEQHDAMRAAVAARAERESHRRRVERAEASDRRRLARIEPAIQALDETIAARQPIIDRLNAELAELAAKIEADPTPPVGDLFRADELREARRQAVSDGAPVHRGVSMHEGGGTVPMQVRVPSPVLLEAIPDVNFWTYGIEPLQRELDRLRAERDGILARLPA
jgi:uncharacterized coiled-coil protein SlyX